MIDNDCKPVGLAPLYKAAAYLGALCCRFVHVKREAAFRELRDVVVGINHLYKITCQLIHIHWLKFVFVLLPLFAFFSQQITLRAKFAKVGGKGTRPSNCQCQCICELKFPSGGNQDGSKKANARMASVRVIRGQFWFLRRRRWNCRLKEWSDEKLPITSAQSAVPINEGRAPLSSNSVHNLFRGFD